MNLSILTYASLGLLTSTACASMAFFAPWLLFAVLLTAFATMILAGAWQHHESCANDQFRPRVRNRKNKHN